ncbi:MAG TPA: sialate O-acetylesterase [Caulifigura sp.]|nr:sialate O-acetylesterase [Caulifigura sp.]
MLRRLTPLIVGLVFASATWSPALANVKLPAIFSSQMVLQRGMPVPVWGWADPGEEVTVTFQSQKKSVKADADGKWMVKLDALTVGEPATLVVKGKNQVAFDDVLIGDVWICSGQSNMEWSINAAIDPDLESLASKNNKLRLFHLQKAVSTTPKTDCVGKWVAAGPDTVGGFSAVAYYFGRQLQQTLDVPVGLINTSWGGTRAEAWTSEAGMASRGEFKPIMEWWEKAEKEYPEKKKAYDEAFEKWKKESAEAKDSGKKAPAQPQPPMDPQATPHRQTNLYNAMIAPIVPYAVKGAIWYQGESNAGRAEQYRTLMAALIKSWRDAWKQGDFPFYQVQLANFMAKKDEPGDSAWAELREAQVISSEAAAPGGVACIIDIGTAKDIHPKNKQDVGKRLARLALVDLFGYAGKVARSGPTYRSMDIKDGKIVLHFDNLGEGGLKGLASYYGEPLTGFSIAGEDRKFVWGDAKIEGETVVVSSDKVPSPVAVRYNWADNPSGNLYNRVMLPAYPFRTDSWEGVTKDKLSP